MPPGGHSYRPFWVANRRGFAARVPTFAPRGFPRRTVDLPDDGSGWRADIGSMELCRLSKPFPSWGGQQRPGLAGAGQADRRPIRFTHWRYGLMRPRLLAKQVFWVVSAGSAAALGSRPRHRMPWGRLRRPPQGWRGFSCCAQWESMGSRRTVASTIRLTVVASA
jgi:hypothetical protein